MMPHAARRQRRLAILDQLAEGHSATALARAVGLSVASISDIARAAGGTFALRHRAGLLYAADVARLLGITERTARRWAAAGLYHTRLQRLDRRVFRVSDRRSLLAFVCERAHFPRLAIAQIADPALRAVAAQARTTAGGRWVSTQEIGAALGYTQTIMSEWMGDGHWTGEIGRVGLYWYGWVPTGMTIRELMRREGSA